MGSKMGVLKAMQNAWYYHDRPGVFGYKVGQRLRKGLGRAREFPAYMHIELTNACNLRCVMCPRSEMKRPVGYMSMELFRSIIDQVPKNSIPAMCLQNFGESTMHQNLVEMIKYAKANPNVGEVHLLTNCTLLDEKLSRELLESKIDMIGLSFEGVDKKTYESLRVGADFEKVAGNIKRLLQIQREIGAKDTVINIQMTRMKETEEKIDGFIRRWQPYLNYNDGIRIKFYDTWAGQVKDRSVKSFDDISGYCKMPENNMVVLWNGDVTICCKDCFGKQIIGNLNRQSIKQIWQGGEYELIRKLMRTGQQGKIELCKNCTDWHKWEREIVIHSATENWKL